jgi:hypothetical protein
LVRAFLFVQSNALPTANLYDNPKEAFTSQESKA